MLRKLLDSPKTYFVGAALLLVLAVASQFEVRLPARDRASAEALTTLRDRDDVNVLFILIDTLRADRLGIYGYERPTSPTLDELARTGIYFERAVAQSSWTKTSMASLWTGVYPANHGILRYNHAVPKAAVLPAEVFRDAGFKTAGIWRNGWVSPNFGFAQGFEVYVRPKPGRERAQIHRNHPSAPALQGTDEDIIDSAVEFFESFGDQRFFLYLHFMDVHQYVYDQNAASFGTSYSDAYDQSINWTDRLIGHLLLQMEESGLLGNTLIVVASDHGEAFREHGQEGHARDLHREVTYVPLIISPPFVLEPGIVVEDVVSNVDIWPTILDLLGLPALPGSDGTSLVPRVLAAAGAGPAPANGPPRVFSQLDRRWGRPSQDPDPLVAVTDGELRLFVPLSNPARAELYDLSSDPLEATNLLETRADAAGSLQAAVNDHVEQAKRPWGDDPEEVELDRMRLDQLRALGYVIK